MSQPRKQWFSWFWLGWALVLAIGFAVVETIALRGKRTRLDTLSQNIQAVVLRNKVISVLSLAGWLYFAGWFANHIWG